MKQLVRRIGKTLALVLPVVLVTTGTLAVTRVPWATHSSSDQQVLTAASADGNTDRTTPGTPDTKGPAGTSGTADPSHQAGASPQDVLLRSLLRDLQLSDPGTALENLDRAMQEHPSLTPYCTGIAQFLGRAAVQKYHGDAEKAAAFARPVCDGSFAAGVAARH